MLGRIPKRRFIFAASLLVILVIITAVTFGANDNVDVSHIKSPAYILVIDPGHGGIDSGAIASDGTKESDINLAIALKMRAIAELYGLENTLIRDDDRTLSDSAMYSERRDLEHRVEIVNKNSNCVYISIHQNCYPTGQPSGSLVIYSLQDDSEKFAKLTHSNLISKLNPDNRRIAEPADDKYYVLSHLNCPAILVECGFMSNFSDMEKLKNHSYQNSIAAVLIGSYLQFCQNEKYI